VTHAELHAKVVEIAHLTQVEPEVKNPAP